MSSSKTLIRSVACAVALGLVLVQAALAADKQPIRFNASDQAAAKAATLKAADLGSGWTGDMTKPDLTPDAKCANKVSDLVLTGAAKSEFTAPGVAVSSEAQVLQSAALVAADWRRTVGNAKFMACVVRDVMNSDQAKVISYKKLAFPKVTQYSVRYRTVADIGKPGSQLRVVMDIVLLAQGRTEIFLNVTMQYANRAVADVAERRLAKILVSRIGA